MIATFGKQSGVHLALCLQTSLLSCLSWIDVFLIFVGLFLLLVLVINRHAAILSDAKLLTSSLRQGESLEHFL